MLRPGGVPFVRVYVPNTAVAKVIEVEYVAADFGNQHAFATTTADR